MQILEEQMVSGFSKIKILYKALKNHVAEILKEQVTSGFIPAKVSYNTKKNEWILEEEYCYPDKLKKAEIILSKGFWYDLATIPRFCWIIIGPHELSPEATLIHDYLYISRGGKYKCSGEREIFGYIKTKGIRYSRKEADDLFLHMMKEAGVSWWRRLLGYFAVRLFAWLFWYSNKKRVDKCMIA